MVAKTNVSGTARPTVAPAPWGLMLTAKLAPIAATDSEIAAHVANDRRNLGCVPGDSAGELMVPISRAATLGPKCRCS